MCEYWVHLEAIAHISRHLRTAAHRSPELDRLLSISSFLSTLARSTSVDLAPLPLPGELVDATTPPDSSGYGRMTGLEYTYGICPSLLIIMERIVTLSQHIAYYATHQDSTSMPPTFIQACEALTTQLSNWIAEAESEIQPQPAAHPDLPTAAFSSPSRGWNADDDGDRHSPSSPTQRLLAHCHQLAFAHGLRVYYHTRIQPCPRAQMQTHVRRVGRYLLRIEELRQQQNQPQNTGGPIGGGGASIMWPGFIAACEADDDDDDDEDYNCERKSKREGERGGNRDLWRTWWSRMLAYRIGNIACLWEVVRAAWRARDAGATESPAWMPVLRRSGRRVLAV